MKSILQSKEDGCLICGNPYTEEHHVFFGTANRSLSERYGMKVYLCAEHHRGRRGAHQDRDLDLLLKKMAQKKFEETYTEDFVSVFGRSYR